MQSRTSPQRDRRIHVKRLIFGFAATSFLGLATGVIFAYSPDLSIITDLDDYAPGTITRIHARDGKLIEGAIADLTAITGQKPQVTKARKSIAQFKLREGMPIGAHVTLRGDRMWEFLDRLLTLALPRIRDFRGLSPRQFDGRGNYTFGLTEQVMFHEINQDNIDRSRGMDITVVTTATNDDEGRALLKLLGFPYKEN